ncbi:MAG: AraC family transcriptional regulator [Verrucomicrobiae bacterium]|nr:AraC family transcriptional regulator [Verrucomicrobiae bacterium]
MKIRAAHKTFCDARWRWNSRLQSGDFRLGFNLWYVARGEGRLETPGGSYELGAGDCFLLRSWEEHLGITGPGGLVVVSWCCYDYFTANGKRLAPDPVHLPPRHRRMIETAFFESLMDRLIEAWQADPQSPLARHWLAAALAEVARQDQRQPSLSGVDLEHARMMETIRQSIRENPGRNHKVSKMAGQAAMSTDHFIRIFKKHTGVTPHEFAIVNRIEAARGLLLSSSQTISQIADQLGYGNIYAFSRQFRERTGHSPSQFRSASMKLHP